MTDPVVYCRHLLICRSVWHNNQRPELGYSVGGIYTTLEPDDGLGFPFRLERMFVYAQLWGDDGEYRAHVRLVKIDSVGYDDEVETQLGGNEGPRSFPMPTIRPITITGLDYKVEVAFPIFFIPFSEPGSYEFQFWIDGIDYPVGRERIQVGG